jgi:hypothetical protein
MTTYNGHKWQMVVNGYVVNEWVIDSSLGDKQHFFVTELDVSRIPGISRKETSTEL